MMAIIVSVFVEFSLSFLCTGSTGWEPAPQISAFIRPQMSMLAVRVLNIATTNGFRIGIALVIAEIATRQTLALSWSVFTPIKVIVRHFVAAFAIILICRPAVCRLYNSQVQALATKQIFTSRDGFKMVRVNTTAQ